MTLKETLKLAKDRFKQNEITYWNKCSVKESYGGRRPDWEKYWGYHIRAGYISRILDEYGSAERITECDVLKFLVEICTDPDVFYNLEDMPNHMLAVRDIYKIVQYPDDVTETLIDEMFEGV